MFSLVYSGLLHSHWPTVDTMADVSYPFPNRSASDNCISPRTHTLSKPTKPNAWLPSSMIFSPRGLKIMVLTAGEVSPPMPTSPSESPTCSPRRSLPAWASSTFRNIRCPVEIRETLSVVPRKQSVGPARPKSPCLSELQPRLLAETDDVALGEQRWKSMPEMAKTFLKVNMLLICTFASQREKKGSESFVRCMTAFYQSVGLSHMMLYHMCRSEIASHIDDASSLFTTFSLCHEYFSSWASYEKAVQEFSFVILEPIVERLLDTKASTERLNQPPVKEDLSAMMGKALLNYTLLPDNLHRVFSLLKLRLAEKYPTRSKIIYLIVCRLLLCGILRDPLVYGISLRKLIVSILEKKDYLSFLSFQLDSLTSRAFSVHSPEESQDKLLLRIGKFCAVLSSTSRGLKEQHLLPRVADNESGRRLLQEIGKYLLDIRMFRCALCELHFGMRLPLPMWDADMIAEFVDVSGYAEYAPEFRSRGITGFTLADADTPSQVIRFVPRLGVRKKILKQLLRVQRAYEATMTSRIGVWTVASVCCWLADIGFGGYLETFYNHRIDGRALFSLSRRELRYMGVEDLEDQQELMDEIFRVVDAERNLTDSFATVVKTHSDGAVESARTRPEAVEYTRLMEEAKERREVASGTTASVTRVEQSSTLQQLRAEPAILQRRRSSSVDSSL